MVWAFLAGLIAGWALATWRVSSQQHQEPTRTMLAYRDRERQLLHEVELHVRALHDRGLPWQVEEYNDGHVMVFTVLPGIEGIGRIFQQYGDNGPEWAVPGSHGSS